MIKYRVHFTRAHRFLRYHLITVPWAASNLLSCRQEDTTYIRNRYINKIRYTS